MNTLMMLLSLGSLIGGGVSAWKKRKFEKDTEAAVDKREDYAKKEGLKNAMARVLNVDAMPYTTPPAMPKSPDTTWSDILQGAGRAGAQGIAQYQAASRYPTTPEGYVDEDIRNAYARAIGAMR